MSSDVKSRTPPAPMTLLRSFIDAEPIAASVAEARWTLRESAFGTIECLDPTEHGKLSGQICEYFAQQQLLTAFSKSLDQTLLSFAGNIVRTSSRNDVCLSWRQLRSSHAIASLAVNIGSRPIQIECEGNDQAVVSLATGEAVLMSLRAGLSFRLSGSKQGLYFIEGYYFSAN